MRRNTDRLRSLQSVALDILREAHGSLQFDDILDEVSRRRSLAVRDPRKALKNAIGQVELIQATQDGHYAYVPNVLAGASFRLPLAAADIKTGRLRVGPEIVAALWPGKYYSVDHASPIIGLSDGQTVSPAIRAVSSFTYELLLPKEFGEWVKKLRRDAFDALVLRCQDGNSGRFTLEHVQTVEVGLVAIRNAHVLEIAQNLFLHTKSVRTEALALRLLARGAYHGEPQPDPLAKLLFDMDGRFCIGNGLNVDYRPDLTPALRRLLAARLSYDRAEADLVQNALAKPLPLYHGLRRSPAQGKKSRATAGRRVCYRFKVRLQWDRRVWRIIEILDHQTLVDLHYAIQDAFNWDNDHMYSFFLSGRAWDGLTEIAGPFDLDREDSPVADEVEIADLELQLNQEFLYLFDYGDELRHEVELVEVLPVPEAGTFPRVVEQHGEAPPQYPMWYDDDEEEE